MHFSLLVVDENYEEQLFPFYEDNRLSFFDETEHYREEYKNGVLELIELKDGHRITQFSKEADIYWKRKYEHTISSEDELIFPEDVKLKKVKFCEFYKTFKTFVNDYLQIDYVCGKCGYWYNPNAKWDWYQVGGRWANCLPLKDGTNTDTTIWKDVDINKLQPTYAILRNGCWQENEDNNWSTEFAEIIKDIEPETIVSIIDCHI